MRVCILGAGAIGGFIAARLAAAGNQVSLIARGAQLAAIQNDGLRLKSDDRTDHVQVQAAEDAAMLGPQDLVIVTVKAPALAAAVGHILALQGPKTPVVVAMNGIPWWFVPGLAGMGGQRLAAADPDGVLASAIAPDRLIGCVLHIACSVPEPGLVIHHGQNRFLIGAPDPAAHAQVANIVETLSLANIGAEAVADIRLEVWQKLLGNVNFAPVSLITRATNDRIAGDPGLRDLCIEIFEEADRVGRRLGLDAGMTAQARIDLGGSLVGFRTSMLQDFERAKPVELDAIMRTVIELGDVAGVDTPVIDAVFALAVRAAREAGCY